MIDVINSFASRQLGGGALTVTRTATAVTPYDTKGRAAAGTTSTLPIIASVQRKTGRDLQVMIDAQITTEVRVLYTGTALKAREPGFAPDQVTGVDLDGDVWTVFDWEPYTAPDGDKCYRVLVARRSMK